MPQYNGVAAYMVEVLGQLLWCYAVLGAFFTLFFGSILALLSWQAEVFFIVPTMGLMHPTFALAVLQLMSFGSFHLTFAPRFPYAAALVTFVLATLYAALVMAVVAIIENFTKVGLPWTPSTFVLWSHLTTADVWVPVLFSLAISIVWGGLGWIAWLLERALLSDRYLRHLRFTAWLGRLIVGREAFDRFIEREQERLQGVPFRYGAASEMREQKRGDANAV